MCDNDMFACMWADMKTYHWSQTKKGILEEAGRITKCYFEPPLLSGELLKKNAAAESRLPGPKGPRWNNQSLTGAGPATAPECCVPVPINRPG